MTRVSGRFNSCVVQQTTQIKSPSLTFEILRFNAVYINLICLYLFIFQHSLFSIHLDGESQFKCGDLLAWHSIDKVFIYIIISHKKENYWL